MKKPIYVNRNNMIMKKKKKRRRRVAMLLIIIFLSVGGYFAYTFAETYQAAKNSYDDLGREKSEFREEKVTISNDPVSVLLMGVESYSTDGANGRTDALMLATFNPEDGSTKLLSIPRDTRVDIPEHGMDKINHAYAYGSEELTIQTVENFFNIPIDYYATVDFEGFKNIVDILNGIEVDVPFDFEERSDEKTGAEMLQFKEGTMTLNGREALAYARMRKEDPRGDLGRVERQKQVLEAMVDKLTSMSTIFKTKGIAEEIGANVQTNLRPGEGLAFYNKYSDFNVDTMEQVSLDGYDDYINGIYYYMPDEASRLEIEQEFKIHLDLMEPQEDVTETQSDEGEATTYFEEDPAYEEPAATDPSLQHSQPEPTYTPMNE
ncbi:LCP family protein [Pontibacillus litoralis]|uniref:Cell envelope-related transcriptional attenuator domain-containing protein n=1 Tax=Pontibacillus litoralis JSM 072002 TaxID=1385512 RepID=A0A0A5HRW8_9BACI|nr:LCP family protein [Pontibacillus litoralis]KGX86377.1 hypothetical protein N784_05345 [Pontibacillus litoralis JSM 072002]